MLDAYASILQVDYFTWNLGWHGPYQAALLVPISSWHNKPLLDKCIWINSDTDRIFKTFFSSELHCSPQVTISRYMCRADSSFAPSQWETALLCNDVSHWLIDWLWADNTLEIDFRNSLTSVVMFSWLKKSLSHCQQFLTHWGRDKMADILRTTFSNACSSMKIVVFWFKFHCNMFPWSQSTIIQHWLRQ